jgi:hypothetical protein
LNTGSAVDRRLNFPRRSQPVPHCVARQPIMFDAVLIPGGAQSATGLTAIVDAVHFVL